MESINSQDIIFLVVLFIGILLFYMLIYPSIEKKDLETKEQFVQSLNNNYKVDLIKCSKDCCGEQWPVSFDTNHDPNIRPGNGTKPGEYIPNNFNCSGGVGVEDLGVGCPCWNKDQRDFLANRGNNA